MKIDVKSLKMQIKAIDDSGEFEGYAAVFGNVDEVGDVIEYGAFSKTIQESEGKLPILDQHSFSNEIGMTEEMREDGKGLWVRGKLYIDDANPRNEIPEARAAYIRMKRRAEAGRPMGMSIGYRSIKDEIRDGIRRLKEVRLFEVSTTPIPANPLAGVEAVKSAAFDNLDQIMAHYQSEIKAGTLTDAEVKRVRDTVNALQTLLDTVNASSEPGAPTQSKSSGAESKDEPDSHSSVLDSFRSELKSSLSWVDSKKLAYDLAEFSKSLKNRGV